MRAEDRAGSAGRGAGKMNWEPAFAEAPDLQPQKYPHLTVHIPTGHQPPGLYSMSIVIRKQDSY